MSKKLYEVSTDLLTAIENAIESESVAITEEKNEQLIQNIEAVQIQFNDKALGIGHYCLNEEADITAIEFEIGRLTNLKKSKEKAIQWLKDYLKAYMEITNTQKIETAFRKIKIVNNAPSTVIDNIKDLSSQYQKYTIIIKGITGTDLANIQGQFPDAKIENEPMKTLIKETIQGGIGVTGAHIETKTRLEIK